MTEQLRESWRAGLLVAGLGMFIILFSAGVIEGKPVSARRALFNDPRDWQIAAFGGVFLCAGLLLVIPQRAQALGRFTAMAFTMVLLAAAAGTVWFANGGARRQKGGSMNAFLDALGAWFQSHGVHPVLGAFLLGAVIAFAFAYRRNPEGGAPGQGNASPTKIVPQDGRGPGTTTVRVEDSHVSMTVDGRQVAMPQAILDHVRAGRKIEAIKELRAASDLDLAQAKKVIDMLAESRIARGGNA